jgi:hypothetical protein
VEPQREMPQIGFIVDTNCINARQRMENMNKLEGWASNEVISLETTEIAQNEMVVGNNSARINKAYNFIYTMSEIELQEERELLDKIEKILFSSGADTQNKKNDVEIVFNAAKYLTPLITNDGDSISQPGGILGNRANLALLGIKVMNPAEAVELLTKEISNRDDFARTWASHYNKPVPSWVGQD